ncbi:hypothetical protein DL96DRAFT_1705376 [Flagelloscypha sp. PMI_526]|nr:hypothetical protein DL96DRAFT_1705376 [Flagelloscypha sp. PMI_526]
MSINLALPCLPIELHIRILQYSALSTSHVERVNCMLVSKNLYHVVSDVVYHTIILHNERRYNGFAIFVESKPSTFFIDRTRALYISESTHDGSESTLQWSKLWTTVIPKLPSLQYLDTFSEMPFTHMSSVRQSAIQVIESLNNLTFLTLDPGLSVIISALISHNKAPKFSHLTHLRFSFSPQHFVRVMMFRSSFGFRQSFPVLSHLILPIDVKNVEHQAELLIQLQVLILVMVPPIDVSWRQLVLLRFSNVVFRDCELPEDYSKHGVVHLKQFLSEVREEWSSPWIQAEEELRRRVYG